MTRSFKILLMVVLVVVLAPCASWARANPFTAEALVLNPPAAAAPPGHWTYAASCGYMWVPEAAVGTDEAEWAPWDPWWVMPYGRWSWADGVGWGWTPVIPSPAMSPLGWGWDGWYGGWYGYLPNGWPSNTLWSFGQTGSRWEDRERAIAWTNRHGPHKWDGPLGVKVVAVVAKPPAAMNPIRPMKEIRDGMDPGNGRPGYEAPGRGRGRGHHGRTEPARTHGDRTNNGRGGGSHVGSDSRGSGHSGGIYVNPGSGGSGGFGGFGRSGGSGGGGGKRHH